VRLPCLTRQIRFFIYFIIELKLFKVLEVTVTRNKVFTMDELQKLEHLSLVSKICSELDNHYNMNDKDLAEFIIDLAEKNPTTALFKKALIDNGAEFADSFIENILRIIKHMKPKVAAATVPKKSEKKSKSKMENLAENFPFLSLPDQKKHLDEGELNLRQELNMRVP